MRKKVHIAFASEFLSDQEMCMFECVISYWWRKWRRKVHPILEFQCFCFIYFTQNFNEIFISIIVITMCVFFFVVYFNFKKILNKYSNKQFDEHLNLNLKKNIRSNCNHKCWFITDDNYFNLLAHILLVLIVLRSITAICWHFGLIDSLDPLLSFLFLRNKSVFNFCVFDSCYLFTHSFIHSNSTQS